MQRISTFLATLVYYPFIMFIGALFVAGGIGAVVNAPVWVFGVSLFLSIFHWGDYPKLDWNGRILRTIWIVTLTACIVGAVWIFVPNVEPGRWWYTVLNWLIVTFVSVGLIIGLVEGIKPKLLMSRIDKVIKWWFRVGGV